MHEKCNQDDNWNGNTDQIKQNGSHDNVPRNELTGYTTQTESTTPGIALATTYGCHKARTECTT